jgi:hypothetical protein
LAIARRLAPSPGASLGQSCTALGIHASAAIRTSSRSRRECNLAPSHRPLPKCVSYGSTTRPAVLLGDRHSHLNPSQRITRVAIVGEATVRLRVFEVYESHRWACLLASLGIYKNPTGCHIVALRAHETTVPTAQCLVIGQAAKLLYENARGP